MARAASRGHPIDTYVEILDPQEGAVLSLRTPWRPATPAAALVFLFAAVAPLAGQTAGDCAVSGGIGVAVPSDEATVIEPFMSDERFTTDELSPGLALGLDAACPLGGPWRASVGGERLDLVDAVFWHFLAGISARVEPAPRLSLSAGIRVGWRHAVDTRPLSPLLPVDFQDEIRLGDSGPTAGMDLRLSHRAAPNVELFAETGWRVGWLGRWVVGQDGGVRRGETETVHAFPLTGGVAVRF